MTKLEVLTREPVGPPVGPSLLLIHGAWHGAWAWANYQGAFAEHKRLSHAISLAGHGKSPGSARRVGVRTHLRDLRAFIDELPAPPVLIGHSMGGYLIQCLLAEREFPAAVLLASVPSAGSLCSTLRGMKKEPLTLVKCGVTLNMRHAVATPEQARHWLYSPDTPGETVERTFAQLGDESVWLFLQMLWRTPRPLAANRRVLVLGGGKDQIFEGPEFEETARTYGATLKTYEQMAHNLTDDDGWATVADDIHTWLTSHGL